MLANRDVWLEMVFRVEGGYSNNPDDPGLSTNLGITQGTLSSWRGEECGPEEVANLTEEEARDIYLSRYWGVMRGDLLPSGLDIYICDFAVNSGPVRAAKILQELIDTKVDSFIGPKTMEAIRAKQPLQLLLDYHAARMDFLMGLGTWSVFGRGWTNRCSKVLALARSKVERRPTLTEMASSTIVKGAAVGAAVSTAAVTTSPSFDWSGIWDLLQRLLHDIPGLASGLPEALQSAEPSLRGAVEAANQTAAMPGLAGHVTAIVTLGTSLYTIWRRYRMYKKGLS